MNANEWQVQESLAPIGFTRDYIFAGSAPTLPLGFDISQSSEATFGRGYPHYTINGGGGHRGISDLETTTMLPPSPLRSFIFAADLGVVD